jgi:hypothetical protein
MASKHDHMIAPAPEQPQFATSGDQSRPNQLPLYHAAIFQIAALRGQFYL